MKYKVSKSLLLFVSSFLTIACNNAPGPVNPPEPVEPVVTGVTVSPSTKIIDLADEDSFTASAVVNGTGNPSQEVTWTIDSDIATVNDNGYVSCISTGEAIITATSVENPSFSNTCQLTITDSSPALVDANKIYTNSNVSSFPLDGTRTIKPVVYPNNAKKNVKYISSNSNILSPDENGVVTGVGLGTATIVAYNDNNDNGELDEGEPKTHVVYTIVETDTSKSISLPTEEQEITIKVDQILELHPIFTGTFAYVSGYSDNSDVCEVYCYNTNRPVSQKIRGIKPGTSVVSLYNGVFQGATCRVTVVDNEDEQGLRASHIEFKKDVINLRVGESKDLEYEIYPSSTVDTLSAVDSSNFRVAVVTTKKITARSAGSTIITLTTSNGKIARQRVVVTDDSVSHEDSYYNNYYGDLTWENGADLKVKLHEIIKNKNLLKYDGNWQSNQAADQSLTDYSKIDAVYSSTDFNKTDTTSVWNREHSIPATMMTCSNTGATNFVGRATDFHNLFGAEKSNNSAHGNKNFGYADPTSLKYSQRTDCAVQEDNFEPTDEDKGRLARAIFYMGVMYDEITPIEYKETISSTRYDFTVNQQPIQLVDDVVGYNRYKFDAFLSPNGEGQTQYVDYLIDQIRDDYPDASDSELKQHAYEYYLENYSPYSTGNLKDLLKWNAFEVTYGEYQHNESVYSYVTSYGKDSSKGNQGNRNPFVDYPELVEYVYGSLQDRPGSLKNLTPSYLALSMDKDEIHHYAFTGETPTFEVGEELDVTKLNIKAIKNDLSEATLDPTDLSVDPHTFTEDEIATGYTARVTTSKNSLTIKVEVNGETPPGGDLSYDTCNYQTGDVVAGDYDFGDGKTCVITKNGKSFTVTSGLAAPYKKNNSTKGCQIGKSSPDNVGTLSYVTTTSLSSVNGVFFKIGTAASKSYHYVVRVGETVILEGNTDSADNKEYGVSFLEDSYDGVVSIEFSNVSAAIYVKGLAINTK